MRICLKTRKIACTAFVMAAMAVQAQADMLIPPTRAGSSDWGVSESVDQMFDGNPSVGSSDGLGNQWDSGGEFNLIAWMDFGSNYVFSALDFATQSNEDGFNRVKLWISNTLSNFTIVNGSTPPEGPADLDAVCAANGYNFAQYPLSAPITARYIVAQFLSERISNTSIFHPRVHELRMEGTVPPYFAASIVNPENNQTFLIGNPISATVTVVNGTAPYTVTFYKNRDGGSYEQAGVSTSTPYTLGLGSLAPGIYGIYVTVQDATNAMLTTATNFFAVQTDNTGIGGTITYTDASGRNPKLTPYSDGYVVHTFSNTGTSILSIPVVTTGSVLVVAGGGGGGYNCGGGGGAGGLIYYGPETPTNGHAEGTNYDIAAGITLVTVGSGGDAGNNISQHGGPGQDSWLGGLQAIGGGGGADRDYGIGGATGGSGGGGSGQSGDSRATAGSGTSDQGFAGGNGTSPDQGSNSAGGGGGGAGYSGYTGTVSGPGGNGGVGLQYYISGTAAYYAGGGAGLGLQQSGALGGLGGGGNESQSATASTGGGGGGGNNGSAGTGGSGIVIVRYPYVNYLPRGTVMSIR